MDSKLCLCFRDVYMFTLAKLLTLFFLVFFNLLLDKLLFLSFYYKGIIPGFILPPTGVKVLLIFTLILSLEIVITLY